MRASRAAPRESEPEKRDDDSVSYLRDDEEDDHRDKIPELDELRLERFEPETFAEADRPCLGALALVKGASFAGELKLDLDGPRVSRRSLRVRFPLGADELRTVFAFKKHKPTLKVVPGAPPVERRKRREAERARSAAEAAAPEVLEMLLYVDIRAGNRRAGSRRRRGADDS